MSQPFSDALKRAAAARAMTEVREGMRLGLGTGSTAAHFVELLGQAARDGLDVLCVPTSERTHAQAKALGLRLSTLDETPRLDLTVDGADEADPRLNLIKGGGGALLREKIVACASDRMIAIMDDSKLAKRLGAFPLPVEIDRFGARATRRHVEAAAEALGLSVEIAPRKSAHGEAYLTDGGNLIFDCRFGAIDDPETLAATLARIPGVVEHGLFVDVAQTLIVAGADGVRVIDRATSAASAAR